MTQSVQSEPWIYNFSRVLFGSLTHVLSVVFTVCIAVLARPGSSLFSWHPFMMTLAFSFFMTEAVLLFSPHSSPFRKLPHKTKGRLHWMLQVLCVCCACIGLGAISYNKFLNDKPHFTSWHGILGLITICVIGVQCFAALPLIYVKLAKGWSLAKLKRYHAVTGLLTYLLASASLVLGLWSAWFSGTVNGQAWYVAVLCPSLSALVIMSQVTNAYLARKQMQSWELSCFWDHTQEEFKSGFDIFHKKWGLSSTRGIKHPSSCNASLHTTPWQGLRKNLLDTLGIPIFCKSEHSCFTLST